MTDRLTGHLHRRAGRRRSTPTSPSSPTLPFQRKYGQGRSQDGGFPVFFPPETTPGSTSTCSPSIDVKVPSPTFDLSSISPALNSISGNAFRRQNSAGRASDDIRKNRPDFIAEPIRPATSGSSGEGAPTTQARSKPIPDHPARKDSPITSAQRTSDDAQRRPSVREDEISIQRAATFWANYDKNMVDETNAPRGVVNSKKSRFNLLSPITLFNRRRSSQNTNKLEESSLSVNTLHVPAMPDKIETSIRGTRVHDFSAPRARRMNSDNSPRPGPAPSPSYPRRPSELTSPPLDSTVGTPSSLHSPVFKEHFQEERRPVQPANTAYLHGQNLQIPSPGALPTFARNLPLTLPDEQQAAVVQPEALSEVLNDTQLDLSAKPNVPPPPELSPPPPPRETSAPAQDGPTATALPRHTVSSSSRFSFLGQQGSIAQERAMEEKHKEHALKHPAQVRLSVVSVDGMDEDDDYSALDDDDDGFDNEHVTIRNVDVPSSQRPQEMPLVLDDDYDYDDDAEDGFGTGNTVIKHIDMPSSSRELASPSERNEESNIVDFADQEVPGKNPNRQSLQAFHFTPQSLSFSPTTTHYTTQSTPRDIQGFAIGKAETIEDTHALHPRIRDSAEHSPEMMLYQGLGISTTRPESFAAGQSPLKNQPFDDGDLYFDDGEFDGALDGEFDVDCGEADPVVDEETLDDASRIRDIPAENAQKYEEALQRSCGDPVTIVSQFQPHSSLLRAESPDEAHKIPSNMQAGLTEGNLAAYHDALALAAAQAHTNGKFNRTVSFDQASDDAIESPIHSSVPGLSSRGSRYSNNMTGGGISDQDGHDFDDDMDDEAMIAAANAEALENDDDGWYGQEFGFYARAGTRVSAEFTNGGYFAPRGSNGIKRSHSGRNNFQEPSLTPITERSEWSNRNSVASLPLHTGFNGLGQSLPSPGIAQLLQQDSPLNEHEMSMELLVKLRGKAFGGSSTSINSLVDRHHSHSSPLAQTSGYHSDGAMGRTSSPIPNRNATGIAELEDGDDDGGRATLMQNTPHRKLAHPVRDTSHSSQEQAASSPISRKGHHSRNSSGAESVSYAQDDDGRWILERRRTGDNGEVELVGREYLAGARI